MPRGYDATAEAPSTGGSDLGPCQSVYSCTLIMARYRLQGCSRHSCAVFGRKVKKLGLGQSESAGGLVATRRDVAAASF
jgi:hypothetical protein